ncbi:MAG: hypothetical protein S4CHLAM7_07940 [Chlamydiae bacterium]|nr:hypothetical protein [Chlamydiota bacterium]
MEKIKLDFDKAFAYFKDNLEGTNSLCDYLMNHLKNGSFFTYLPDFTDKNAIYNFKLGGIAKGLIAEFPNFLVSLINSKKKASYIFDALGMTYDKEMEDPIFHQYGRYIDDEVYFYISKKNANLETLKECYYRSHAIWHSVCILVNDEIQEIPNTEISNKELQLIYEKIEMIFVLAYDAESYVVWEK